MKIFFAKGYTPNWSEKVFVIKKIFGTVYKKELQRTNQADFKVEKVIKKAINYILTGKVTIVCLIVRLIKKMLLYNMNLYFPPYEKFSRNI